jgi:crotonobetainyl-CoA:carnitine CoA-transferase CaiB-like acyl-CoA transferase
MPRWQLLHERTGVVTLKICGIGLETSGCGTGTPNSTISAFAAPSIRMPKQSGESVTGTKIGSWPVYELPMKLSRTPAYIGGPINRGAPGYGEDNVWVLTNLLGMSESDVQRLAEDGVI